jgi:hypothetical protein
MTPAEIIHQRRVRVLELDVRHDLWPGPSVRSPSPRFVPFWPTR